MSPRQPYDWQKEDLENLKGQPESQRLEFKESRLFQESTDEIITKLTKEVSAFANTEGGTIVIGVIEEKITGSKAKVAKGLDAGIDITKYEPEWIQKAVEGNIYPPIRGLRFRRVALTSNNSHYAMVIYIPEGSTACQAKDFLYYGRSEFESKPLRDHEIRLRMFKGKSAEAVLIANPCTISSKNGESIIINLTSYPVVNMHFDLCLMNTGELNIRSFKIVYIFSHNYKFLPEGVTGDTCGLGKTNIFPSDSYSVGHFSMTLTPNTPILNRGLEIDWTIFLTDRLPITGKLDVAAAFAEEISAKSKILELINATPKGNED
jgi:hypothetical protein